MPQSLHISRQVLLALILITLLGAFIRINTTLHTTVLFPLRADAGEYFSYAYNLRHEGVYSRQNHFESHGVTDAAQPDAIRSPGYPLTLLSFAGYPPTNKTILDITLMQAALGVLMIPLAYCLSRRILAGFWALIPPLLVAVSPQLVTMGTYVLSETLFTFLLLLGLLALQIQFTQSQKLIIAIASGVLLALGSLTRPTLQYFLPLVLIYIWVYLPSSIRWKQVVAVTAGFLIVFMPWLARNYITLGIVSDSTLTVATIFHGHYPDFMYQGHPWTLGYPYRFDPHAAEIGASFSTITQEILRLFETEPLRYLRWYLIGKPLAYFSWGDVAGAGDIFTYPTIDSPYLFNMFFIITKDIMRLVHPMLMLSAFVAAVIVWKPALLKTKDQGHDLKLLAGVVFYFLTVHVVGFPIARYCVPILPVLFILAVWGLQMLIQSVYARLPVHANAK